MHRKMMFSTYTTNYFTAQNTTHEAIQNLMFDLAVGNDIYDPQSDRVVPKVEAEAKLLAFTQGFFGIDKDSSRRDLKRAIRDHGREFFDIAEDTIDQIVDTGFHTNEFFNDFVDRRVVSRGDALEFIVHHNRILSVTKAGMSHHDFSLQTLGQNERFSVAMDRYVAAVGEDLNLYLLGRSSWASYISAIAIAFEVTMQQQCYAAMLNAAKKLPVQTGFVATGSLSASTKDKFDEVVENVAAANDSDVIIMGTKSALRKLNALSEVDWRSDSLKNDVSRTGRMGDYEGTTLIEIPQRFANDDVTKKLVDPKKLWIIPADKSDKFIKMVDSGETMIDSIMDGGEANGRIDDIMKYEVQRDFGVDVVLGRYFGEWTLE